MSISAYKQRPPIPFGHYWVEADGLHGGWLVLADSSSSIYSPQGAVAAVVELQWTLVDAPDFEEPRRFTVRDDKGKSWRVTVSVEVEPVFRGRLLFEEPGK